MRLNELIPCFPSRYQRERGEGEEVHLYHLQGRSFQEGYTYLLLILVCLRPDIHSLNLRCHAIIGFRITSFVTNTKKEFWLSTHGCMRCQMAGLIPGRMLRLRRKQQNARRRVIIEMRDRLSSHPSSGFLLSWLRVHLHLRERENLFAPFRHPTHHFDNDPASCVLLLSSQPQHPPWFRFSGHRMQGLFWVPTSISKVRRGPNKRNRV